MIKVPFGISTKCLDSMKKIYPVMVYVSLHLFLHNAYTGISLYVRTWRCIQFRKHSLSSVMLL